MEFRCYLSNFRQVVAQGAPDSWHQRVDEGEDHVSRRRHHDLGQADANALTFFGQRRLEAFLQDRDDLGKNALAELLDQVSKGSRCNLETRKKFDEMIYILKILILGNISLLCVDIVSRTVVHINNEVFPR